MIVSSNELEFLTKSQLKEHPRNVRMHNNEQIEALKRSIEKYTFTQPILIDENNTILAGHGRVQAIQDGIEIPCRRITGMTETQKLEYIIVDNKTYELGDWNEEDLQKAMKELDELKDFDFDIDFEEPEEKYTEEQLEDIPENVETICKLGDIWQLGNHRLICGDSTDAETYNKLMGNEKADLLVTDPPYNVSYEGKTKDALTIKNDSMSDDKFYQFLVAFYKQADVFMKNGGSFYIWHADTEGENFRKALKETNLTLRQCLVWVKNTFVMGRQDYHWKHEPCLYGWKEGASHNWHSGRKQSTVIEFDKPNRNGEHPTMKPVGLIEYLIKNSSKQKEIILDAFGGSGSTLIACEQLDRQCRMIELDPKYCDVIIARWEKLTGNKAVKIDTEGENG